VFTIFSKNLSIRLLTAFSLLLVVVPIVWFGGLLRTAIFLVLSGFCMFELYSLTLSLPKKVIYLLVTLSFFPALFAVFVIFFGSEMIFESILVTLLLYSFALIAITEALPNKPDLSRLVSIPIMSICYPGLLLVSLLVIDQRYSGEQILWVMASVIAADTLAFFVGSFAGGRPLSPRISPNKTLAGSFAGILGAALMSLAWGTHFEFDQPVLRLIALGLCIGILAVVGDLFESLLKRSIGVKDMGSLLPGHGGFLDRVDALLFALPVIFLL